MITRDESQKLAEKVHDPRQASTRSNLCSSAIEN